MRSPVTAPERQAWLALALAICDEADWLALASLRRELRVAAKPNHTFVTEADTAIERLARERIRDVHPDHGLVGEEYGTEAGSATVRWYVDPIDGTHNFMRGVPIFATLLAVESDGAVEVAAVSAPALGSRWWAMRGGGAWASHGEDGGGPRRLSVSGIERLGEAHVLHGSSADVEADGRLPGFDRLLRAAWRERGFGDFWGYALVAEGAAEAMIEADLNTWDAAAPSLLVEEAGGRWSDVDGHRRIDTRTFVATNGVLHEEILRTLRHEAGET
jgi:histidinol-phosphatase